ncbi:trichothecene efflux pump [Ophiostoma piceae UAMH 11346]|uniref:Trichothecene efflux pump n=1 Tax=Ophiostoma piceae (strain UAMH 11346) TaxID=1262450 RepID=S3BR16_OPHP1|nr:trichothecene efflux pump [Ophiostoma piceae UAMH 11346]
MATPKMEGDSIQADHVETGQIEQVTDVVVDDDDDNVSVRSEALGDDLPDKYFSSWRFILLVIGFGLTAMSANMFVIMPTNILTYINQDIGPSPYISWVNIARTLSLAFAYTIMGRLSDLFGRRWFYLIGNAIALLGIVVSATAQNVNSLIIGAAVAGLGETVQLSFNVALGELVPNKYRPLVISLIFLMTAPFSTFGPTLARYFVSHPNMGWRYCYFINIAATTLAIILLFICYHPPTFDLLHQRKTKRQILKQLDFVLFVYESKMDLNYPVIPVRLFRNRGFISLMFYYSALLLWPQQISRFFTTDIHYAGWLSTTVASSTVLGQICAGAIIRWAGNVRYWTIFSACAMCTFVGALAALTPERKGMGIAFTIVGPFFVGFIELASLSLAPLFCKGSDIGLASGLLSSIRSAGSSVSVAIYVAILNNRLSTTLTQNIEAVAPGAGIPEDEIPAIVKAVIAGSLAKMSGLNSAMLNAVTGIIPTAYSQAFKTVYLASLAFGGIAIVMSLFSKDVQKHLTDKVERKMHGRRVNKALPDTKKEVDSKTD